MVQPEYRTKHDCCRARQRYMPRRHTASNLSRYGVGSVKYLIQTEQASDGGWSARCEILSVYCFNASKAEAMKLCFEGILLTLEWNREDEISFQRQMVSA